MTPSDFVAVHQPCPCGKSSDAYSIREDGSGHCFSCAENHKSTGEAAKAPAKKKVKRELLTRGVFTALKARDISEGTCQKYGYSVGPDEQGASTQIAEYYNAAGQVVAQKLRYKDKKFSITGDISDAGLFGQQLWRNGGKRVVITEGEIDAMSVAQATGLSWPVVSLPNGASSARKSLEAQLEWLESHEQIVLWFDNDKPGLEAVESVLDLFTPGKLYVVKQSGYKDANEMLLEAGSKAVSNAVWEAAEHRPDGILNAADLWESVVEDVKAGAPYPWKGLNDTLAGIRGGEVVVITAGSGVGKSELCRAIAYNLLMVEGESVGYMALEEGGGRTARGFMGIYLKRPIWKPGTNATLAEKRESFDAVFGKRKLWVYDHWGSVDPDVLLGKMRYVVKAQKAKYIFLDHVSIVVSGMDGDVDERRALDRTMTRLRQFAEETGAGIIVVSHLKRPDKGRSHEEGGATSLSQLRGSGAIAQLSDAVIGAERDQQHSDPEQRKVMTLRVLKSRLTGETGPVCALKYDKVTGLYTEVPLPADEGQVGDAFGEDSGDY